MDKLRPPDLFDYALLILLGAMFGSSFLLMKVAVSTVPTFHVVFFRLLFAFFVLYVFVRIKKHKFPSIQNREFWKVCVVLGFTANIIPFSLITWAEKEIDSGLASIYMATIPVFSLLLAHTLTSDEKLTIQKVVGVCVAFAGVVILLWGEAREISQNLLAQMACLLSAIFYAYSRILAKTIGNENPIIISSGVLLCAIIFMVPLIFLSGNPTTINPSSESIFAIILLGIFPTALAFVILYRLIHDVGAVFMTSVNYLVPVFAIIWGYFILSESINERAILALVFIFSGVLFMSKTIFTIGKFSQWNLTRRSTGTRKKPRAR